MRTGLLLLTLVGGGGLAAAEGQYQLSELSYDGDFALYRQTDSESDEVTMDTAPELHCVGLPGYADKYVLEERVPGLETLRSDIPARAMRDFESGRYEAAIEILAQPSVRGEPVAQYVLGCIMEALSKASFSGPKAMRNAPNLRREEIERAIARSRRVVSEPRPAWKWLQAAAEAGYKPAQWELARRWDNYRLRYSQFVALDWLRRLSSEGAPRASTLLAHLYERGRRLPKDEAEAYRLAAAAASANDTLAMRLLASFHSNGTFVDPDEGAALKWRKAAAAAGDVKAQLMVGTAYAEGRGVAANAVEAAFWLRKAAAAGNSEAGFALGAMLRDGIGLPRDSAEASKYLAQALRGGECNARIEEFQVKHLPVKAPWDNVRIEQALSEFSQCRPGPYGHYDEVFDTGLSPSTLQALGDRINQLGLALGRRTSRNIDEVLRNLASPDPSVSGAAVASLETMARRLAERPPDEEDPEYDSEAIEALAVLAFPARSLPHAARSRINRAYWHLQLDKLRSEERSNLAQQVLRSQYTDVDLKALFTLVRKDGDGGGEVLLLADLGLIPAAFDAVLARLERGEDGASMSLALFERTHSCTSGPFFARWITPMRGFDRGCGVNPPDELLSVQQLERLAKYDFARPLSLALAYLEGRGVEPNSERALSLLLRPDAGQFEKAVAARIYEDGRGVAPNPARAAKIYLDLDYLISSPTLSSEAGTGALATRLGILLFEGWGVVQDAGRAVDMLKHGVGFRAPLAEVGYGDALILGLGARKDEKEALRWYRQAAPDEPIALVRFGFLSAIGRWSERQLDSRHWYDLAAAAQSPGAWLEVVRAQAYGPSPRRADMLELLQRAAAKGNGWAVAWLSACPRAEPRCLQRQPGFARSFFVRLSSPEPGGGRSSAKPRRASAASILNRDVEHLHRRMRALVKEGSDFYGVRPLLEEVERVQTYHGDAQGAIGTRLRILLAEEEPVEAATSSFSRYRNAMDSSCRWGLASRMAQDLGHRETALLFAKIAVNRLQDAREFLSDLDAEVRECFLEMHKDRYRWLADLLIDADRLAEAEIVLGMLKDFEQAAYSHDPRRRRISLQRVAFSKAEASFASRIQAIAADLRLGKPGVDPAPGPVVPLVLRDDDSRFQDSIDALVRELAAQDLKSGSAASIDRIERLQSMNRAVVADLRERLPAGTAVAYALVLPDRVHWILVTEQGRQRLTIQVRQAQLEDAIAAFRAAIVGISPDIQARARKLHRLLFESVDQELSRLGVRTVMLSLDRRLRYLPFSALHDGSQWLVERYAFTSFRRAGDYLRPKKGLPWKAAAFAATGVAPGLPALPAAREEVDEIVGSGAAGGGILEGERRVDGEFTRAALVSALKSDFRVVHIASHFVLDPVNQANSFLQLGDGSRLPMLDMRRDSDFTFSHADLVTLSACQTALGGRYGDGSEIDSLGTVAQEAGAPAVLASLWSVDDRSTAFLMVDFYRRRVVGDVPLTEALRGAQLRLLRDQGEGGTDEPGTFSHPFYWAPFILIGNWQ